MRDSLLQGTGIAVLLEDAKACSGMFEVPKDVMQMNLAQDCVLAMTRSKQCNSLNDTKRNIAENVKPT